MWSCSSLRKKPPRKNPRPAKQKTPRIFPILGRESSVFFFVIEAFGTNAQPASSGGSTQRVWDYPNKHFATQKWRLYIRTPCLQKKRTSLFIKHKPECSIQFLQKIRCVLVKHCTLDHNADLEKDFLEKEVLLFQSIYWHHQL